SRRGLVRTEIAQRLSRACFGQVDARIISERGRKLVESFYDLERGFPQSGANLRVRQCQAVVNVVGVEVEKGAIDLNRSFPIPRHFLIAAFDEKGLRPRQVDREAKSAQRLGCRFLVVPQGCPSRSQSRVSQGRPGLNGDCFLQQMASRQSVED